jgi:hypothetical protein
MESVNEIQPEDQPETQPEIQPETKVSFATRSDRGRFAGIHYFDTFKDAFNHAKKDSTVWKISWGDCTDRMRWVIKYKSDDDKSPALVENKLESLNPAYKNAAWNDGTVFWMHEDLIPVPVEYSRDTEENYQKYQAACVMNILTESEFYERFANI